MYVTDARRGFLRILSDRLAAAKLDVKTPEKYRRRRKLDHTIDAERHEDEAVRENTGANRDHRFDRHPRDCDVLESKRLPD